MAETSTIKSFLVTLGFKSDESSLKKFEDGITKASKAVFGLAAAIEGTAVIVAAGVARFASNLEALYFASMRTGASATNLKAFDRAAQNFGTTAGDALASVEGLARFLRNNPGGESFLQSIGVQTRDAKGNLRDTAEMMVDMGRQFAKMPMYLSGQYANIFGIDERTMLALRNGDFAREFEKMRREMQSAGFAKASADAHRFMQDLRDLQTVLEVFGVQIYDALTNKLGVSMSTLTQWLRVHGPALADRIADAILKIVSVAEWLGNKVLWLVGKFIEWDKATDGWSTRILGFVIALKMLGGFEILSGIFGLTAAFVRLGAGITGVVAALEIGTGIGLGKWINETFPGNPLQRFGEWLGGKFYDVRHQQEGAINRLTDFGLTRQQAIGIVANLNEESALNAGATGDNGAAYGIAQWHRPGQERFRRWAGKDIRQSTADEQLQFLAHDIRANFPGLLGAMTSTERSAQMFSRIYERPLAGDEAAVNRGRYAVQLEAKTTINVDGARDPKAVAREVENAQKRINADLVRNFATQAR